MLSEKRKARLQRRIERAVDRWANILGKHGPIWRYSIDFDQKVGKDTLIVTTSNPNYYSFVLTVHPDNVGRLEKTLDESIAHEVLHALLSPLVVLALDDIGDWDVPEEQKAYHTKKFKEREEEFATLLSRSLVAWAKKKG